MNISRTAAECLLSDPRVAQAKKLLLEAVHEHQGALTHPKSPNVDLQESYKQKLEKFAEDRGGKLWFPYLGSGLGNGCLVELADGSVKYDFISGIGTHYFGHSHPDLIASSIDAAISDTIMQGHLQQNLDSVELCHLLITHSGIDHCFLSTSGATANENALKIVLQKRSPANRILAFERGFAGRTWALAQITDKPSFREGLPSQIFVDYIPFYDPHQPEKSMETSVHALKKHLARHPKEYATMIFELIQGEGGFYPGSERFFRALMDILKENGISIIVDEIQTFGRTSSLFAFQYFNLKEYVDVVTIGKLSQVCATLFCEHHRPRPGLLSQTFTGSTSAIRASKVILEGLINNNFFGKEGKNAMIEYQFALRLEGLNKKYPKSISGPFGIGTMVAFTPFDGDVHRTTKFVHTLFDHGVMSFIAGSHPSRVRFLVPAGAVTEKDIDAVCNIVEQVILSSLTSG